MLNRLLIAFAFLLLASPINSAIIGASKAPAGKTYVYTVVTSATPAAATINGLGAYWKFSVSGGSATFNIAGGTNIDLSSATMEGQFNYAIANPTITATAVQSGAEISIWIDGVN